MHSPYPGRTSPPAPLPDRKSTRLNSSHLVISYAVFCLKKKTNTDEQLLVTHDRGTDELPSIQRPPLLPTTCIPRWSVRLCLSAGCAFVIFFFFNDTATTEIYTLSLHDALPIYLLKRRQHRLAVTRHGGVILR